MRGALKSFAALLIAGSCLVSCGNGERMPDPGGGDSGLPPRSDAGPPPEPSCGPSTCDGCCQGGQCLRGRDDDACGSGGVACQRCSLGERCSLGLCVPYCDSSNCTGCCSGTTCLAGNASTACGRFGEACVDCGPGWLCQDGRCVVDPASRWSIVVLDAEINEDRVDDIYWDPFGGLPDPKVEVYAGGRDQFVGATSRRMNTLFPEWNEIAARGVRADAIKAYLSFRLWDVDDFEDDWIGGCYYPSLSDSVFDGSVQTMTCERDPDIGNSGFVLRWRLQRE